jgi:hypothetical protein
LTKKGGIREEERTKEKGKILAPLFLFYAVSEFEVSVQKEICRVQVARSLPLPEIVLCITSLNNIVVIKNI